LPQLVQRTVLTLTFALYIEWSEETSRFAPFYRVDFYRVNGKLAGRIRTISGRLM
jgi:hypothetical protein